MQIITNNEKQKHMGKVIQLSEESNVMTIVSPFIANDLGDMFDKMPTIKEVTIYTNLSGYSDGAEKIIALHKFCNYCKEKNIHLIIKSDDYLHGKVYLFYKKTTKTTEPKGFIISSGNFTDNGMRKNHEFGVMSNDVMQQNAIANLINDLKTYDVTEELITMLVDKANEHKKNVESLPLLPVFNVDKYINLKPSNNKKEIKFFLKPIGTSDKPFKEGDTLKEEDEIGFGDVLNTIHRRDVFICHATGPQMIVGYYMVDSDKQIEYRFDEEDRWPYKFKVICKSIPYSKKWWEFKLKTKELVESFLQENPGEHITKNGGTDKNGGDTIGSLNFGSERIEITEKFARYIIEKIPDVEE